MITLLTIFLVAGLICYFTPDVYWPSSRYHPPLTQKEVHVLKDNTNRGTEDNIDNLYLELGRIEVELLLEDHLGA